MRSLVVVFAATCIATLAAACSSSSSTPGGDGGADSGPGSPGSPGTAGSAGSPGSAGTPSGGPGTPPDPGAVGQIPDDAIAPKACTGVQSSGASVLCVDAKSTAGSKTGAADAPYAKVQAAVDAAKNGDTIQVAGGEYAENVKIDGKSVTLVGGFQGGGEFGKRDPKQFLTTLRGTAQDVTLYLTNAGTSRVSAFRITGGKGHDVGGRYSGGGVLIEGGQPELSYNIVDQNDATHARTMARGGGVYVDTSDAKVLYNVVRENKAMRGSGIGVEGGDKKVLLKGNIVQKNVSIDDHGGGLFLQGKDVTVTSNLIADNEVGRELTYGWGGGLYAHDKGTVVRLSGNVYTKNYAPSIGSAVFIDNEATAYLDHELLYQNACPDRGGALYVDGLDNSGTTGSNVFVTFTTIADHRCGPDAPAIYVEGDSKLTIKNSVIWGHEKDTFADGTSTITASYVLFQTALPGANNVKADPLFVSAAAGDYHVKSKGGHFTAQGTTKDDATSPAVDAADPAEDASREPVPNGGRAELGAYGNTPQASLSDH